MISIFDDIFVVFLFGLTDGSFDFVNIDDLMQEHRSLHSLRPRDAYMRR